MNVLNGMSIFEDLKKMSDWQELEKKGLLPPEEQALLNQARQELGQLISLFHPKEFMEPGTVVSDIMESTWTTVIRFLAKNPAFIYKQREDTHKKGRRQGVYIKKKPNQDERLYHKKLGDRPEDFFMNQIVKSIDESKTPGEIIEALGKLPDKVLNRYSYKNRRGRRHTSHDENKRAYLFYDREEGRFDKFIDKNLLDVLEILDLSSKWSLVENAIKQLPDRQRQVMELLKKDLTKVEIAQKLKISDSRVSQLEKVAIKNIKKRLTKV